MRRGIGRLAVALANAVKEARLEVIGIAFINELIERKDPLDPAFCVGKLRESAESARHRAELYESAAKALEV